MRLATLALLVLAGCASSGMTRASDTWYVVPTGADVITAYASANGNDAVTAEGSEDFVPGDRYQITGRDGRFYSVRRPGGATSWMFASAGFQPVAYSPEAHGVPTTLESHASDYRYRRRTCASFSTAAEARASYAAGNTRLDGDGDGVPCELGVGGRSPASAAPRPATRPSTRSSSNCHWVRGHTRNGRRVRGHMRCR